MTIKEFREKYGIAITTNHNGKMQGMASLSTAVQLNPMCIARAKNPNTICSKCYAVTMSKMYKPLARNLENNFKVLTSEIIPVNEFPLVNYCIFRLESFGDIANDIQVKNYFNFCKRNPKTTFALWTKNVHIVDAVIASGVKKPSNLILIESSPFINKEAVVTSPNVDKVFTVYDKATAANVSINCGARNCSTCRRCYTKAKKLERVNELLHK